MAPLSQISGSLNCGMWIIFLKYSFDIVPSLLISLKWLPITCKIKSKLISVASNDVHDLL